MRSKVSAALIGILLATRLGLFGLEEESHAMGRANSTSAISPSTTIVAPQPSALAPAKTVKTCHIAPEELAACDILLTASAKLPIPQELTDEYTSRIRPQLKKPFQKVLASYEQLLDRLDAYYGPYRHLFPNSLENIKHKWWRIQSGAGDPGHPEPLRADERIIACLMPETFPNPIYIHGKTNLELRGLSCVNKPSKKAIISPASAPPYTSHTVRGERKKAEPTSLGIIDSRNILIRDLKLINEHTNRAEVYVDEKGRAYPFKKSLAFLASSSSTNIQLENVKLRSRGKNTLSAWGSDVKISGGSVQCYYFCGNAYYSNVIFADTVFTTTHLEDPADMHSVYFLDHSNLLLVNPRITMNTGLAIFSGLNTPQKGNDFFVVVDGKTVVSSQSRAIYKEGRNYWTMEGAAGGGIDLDLFGKFPSGLNKSFYNPWVGKGEVPHSQPHNRVYKHPNKFFSQEWSDLHGFFWGKFRPFE